MVIKQTYLRNISELGLFFLNCVNFNKSLTMTFSQFMPHPSLQPFVECYRIMEGTVKMANKVVADGKPELIFHYGDCYKIQRKHGWDDQSHALIAGQLVKPLNIRATGTSGVFGIKFTPTGLWRLFQVKMNALSNDVIDANAIVQKLRYHQINERLHASKLKQEKVLVVENVLMGFLSSSRRAVADPFIQRIIESKGQLQIARLCKQENISQRKLERCFAEEVGVSPKMYARIIRFSAAFKLLQQRDLNRIDVAYLAGYFDQSHFNKDFKAFSGEDPQSTLSEITRFQISF
jgi:AraC-like DNA-binding protein